MSVKSVAYCRPHWAKGFAIPATHYSGDIGHDGPTRCEACKDIVCVTCGKNERQAMDCTRCLSAKYGRWR